MSCFFLFFFITVFALSALDRDMDVYATSQKSRLCPHYKRNCSLSSFPSQFWSQGRFPPHCKRGQGVDQLPTHCFCSSRSSHSQLFLFSSQLSHSPAAAHIWFSFSASSMHLRFLQRCHGGHLCSSSSSGQRDKVLERAEIKGDTSSSFFSSTFCSCSCNSSLQSPLVGDIIREKSRGESPEGLLIFSGEGRVLTFLCAFPLWIFKPFSDLKEFPHSSHLKASFSDEGVVFLLGNSSFLLWFLLNLEGLSFFFRVTTLWSTFRLVSREKEKEEPIFKEMLNDCPLLASAWQKSKHWVKRAGSSPATASDIIFTGQSHIGEVLDMFKQTGKFPIILSEEMVK